MISIIRAREQDADLLTTMGRTSFVESHGHSATIENINQYLDEKYTPEIVQKELRYDDNIYHIIYYNNLPAGYSKINFNTGHPSIISENVTKLERLYLLKPYYALKLGLALLKFNIELSQKYGQSGMWLYVWTGNDRAITFYNTALFKIIGKYDFKLTENHANPNYQMLLMY